MIILLIDKLCCLLYFYIKICYVTFKMFTPKFTHRIHYSSALINKMIQIFMLLNETTNKFSIQHLSVDSNLLQMINRLLSDNHITFFPYTIFIISYIYSYK